MLEPIFKQIIDSITKVVNSHVKDHSENAMLSRNWEFIFSEFDEWIILHCYSRQSIGGYWLYPQLYPDSKLKELRSTLPNYSISPTSGGYDHVMSGKKHWIEPFWKDNEDLQSTSIPLFFDRLHYGNPKGEENYIEFNQLITHPLDLHQSYDRKSYCSVDDNGEKVEDIKIINDKNVSLILIRRETLDKILLLGEWALIRYIDFTRQRTKMPNFNKLTSTTFVPPEYDGIFQISKSNQYCPINHQ